VQRLEDQLDADEGEDDREAADRKMSRSSRPPSRK
jgi:hypothetical protein